MNREDEQPLVKAPSEKGSKHSVQIEDHLEDNLTHSIGRNEEAKQDGGDLIE